MQKEYRYWLNDGKSIWKWEGQYVKLISVDYYSNKSVVEVKLKKQTGAIELSESKKIFLTIDNNMLETDALVKEFNNGVKFYENDIIQNALSGELYKIEKEEGEFFVTGASESVNIHKFFDPIEFFSFLNWKLYEVVGNIRENEEMWNRHVKNHEERKDKRVQDKKETIHTEEYDEINSKYKKLQGDYNLLEEEVENLEQENEKLRKHNQYAEHYLEQSYKDTIEKDKLIHKLQEENRKLKQLELDEIDELELFKIITNKLKTICK